MVDTFKQKHFLVDQNLFQFLNIYAPNDQTQLVKFLSDLSTSVINQVVNEGVDW